MTYQSAHQCFNGIINSEEYRFLLLLVFARIQINKTVQVFNTGNSTYSNNRSKNEK